MIDLLYQSFSRTGSDELLWKLDGNRLRILCYHGICEDSLAGARWMPSFFVTRTAFEEQLQYLGEHAHVLPLAEAVQRLRDGTLPPRTVTLTFDDGYANNLELAYPLLAKYDIPATIFLSTHFVETGEFYPFLKMKLIRLSGCGERLPEYKSSPVDAVTDAAQAWWPEVEAALLPDVRDALRPMRVDDLAKADPRLVEFGAHSHTHCILRNESDSRRRDEIRTSIRKVAEWTGRISRLFSYPNGERGDFDEADKAVLRAEGIEAAVSGIGGANSRPFDPLELRRYPITLHHIGPRFSAEVTGFRNALLAATSKVSL